MEDETEINSIYRYGVSVNLRESTETRIGHGYETEINSSYRYGVSVNLRESTKTRRYTVEIYGNTVIVCVTDIYGFRYFP